MKLVSFETTKGGGFGVVKDDGIVDLSRSHGDQWATLADMIGGCGLGDIFEIVENRDGDLSLSDVTYLPPIPMPSKIFGLGLNYKKHIIESGRDIPEYPMLFTRYPDSMVAHRQDIIVPRVSERLDYEGEMAVVISKHCRYVPAAEAFDVVAGYSCFNEGSVRDYQRHTSQFIPGKTFWRSGSFGPWIVTPDEAPSPDDMILTTRFNGEVMQKTEVSDLLFKVPELIEYISQICPLAPGDVIITGTPDGVGDFHDPPIYMKAGDEVKIEVSGVGVLENRVADEN